MSIQGSKVPLETLMLAMAVDALNALVWARTDGGERPPSVVDIVTKKPKLERLEDVQSYASASEFEKQFAMVTGGTNG